MTVVQQLKEALDTGDPTVRTWLLVDNYFLPPVLCLVYTYFVMKLGPQIMRNKKPFDLRNVMMIYNFALVAVYVVCILTVFYHLLFSNISYDHICNKTLVVPGDPTYALARVGHVIYLLKYVEFLDTIFFILRKKDNLVSGLHVVHHASLPFVGWIVMRTEFSGFQFFPGILNAGVHVIMYSYYGLAALGPSVRQYLWWKKYLTILQMVQFVLIFLFVVVFVPMTGCATSRFGAFVDCLFALLFLVLFYDYYRKAYKPSQYARKEKVTNGVHSNHSNHAEKNEISNNNNNNIEIKKSS